MNVVLYSMGFPFIGLTTTKKKKERTNQNRNYIINRDDCSLCCTCMIIIRRAKALRRRGEFSVSSIQLVSLRDTSGIEKVNDARTRFFFNDENKPVGFMRRNKTKKWHAANTTKNKRRIEAIDSSLYYSLDSRGVGCSPVLHHRTKRSNDVMSRAHPPLPIHGDEEPHPDGIGLIAYLFELVKVRVTPP